MSQRVLITGGASGLGYALAKDYCRRGASVLITDIIAERGEQAAADLAAYGNAAFILADTRSEADWQGLKLFVESNFGALDILVNNAGVAAAGRVDRIPMEDWQWIMDINLTGVMRGCRTFVPMMKASGSGHIVNIASLAAIASAPAMSSYNVSKAGVVSLSETLRFELEPYGIHTTVVCPSFFQTDLAATMRTPEPGMERSVRKLLAGGKLSADQVAGIITHAVDRRRFLVLPQTDAKAIYYAKRYLPFAFQHFMAKAGRQMQRKFERG